MTPTQPVSDRARAERYGAIEFLPAIPSAEQREAARGSTLCDRGDMLLGWINEGDLGNLAFERDILAGQSVGDYVRPEVAAFARLMERQLRANDHKPGWKRDDPNALLDRCEQEWRELADAVAGYGLSRAYEPNFAGLAGERKYRLGMMEVTAALGREAADVGNFAMMVADVCGALTLAAAPSSDSPTCVSCRVGPSAMSEHTCESSSDSRKADEARAIAIGHKLDAEDGGYPTPASHTAPDALREAIVRIIMEHVVDGDPATPEETADAIIALTTPAPADTNAALVEALEPFASFASNYDKGGKPCKRPVAADYRRARAALNAMGEKAC